MQWSTACYPLSQNVEVVERQWLRCSKAQAALFRLQSSFLCLFLISRCSTYGTYCKVQASGFRLHFRSSGQVVTGLWEADYMKIVIGALPIASAAKWTSEEFPVIHALLVIIRRGGY